MYAINNKNLIDHRWNQILINILTILQLISLTSVLIALNVNYEIADHLNIPLNCALF